MDKMYELAIKTGDMAYIDEVTSTEGHIDVPILHADPFYMLDHASHEALAWLDEQEYIVLPDVVKAIIYDDPIYLYGLPLSHKLLEQILKHDRRELHAYYRENTSV